MKENKCSFFAGLAGGFGFYIAWMILVILWQTSTVEEANIKSVIGLILGLVVGILLYFGVYLLVNKKSEVTSGDQRTKYTIYGIAAGLAIAFVFGLLFYNPTGMWPDPLFPLN